MPTSHKPALQFLAWGLFSLCGLISAIFISWILWAKVDFAYPLLHDAIDIQGHTQKFGPQNRYRHGFQFTDRQERIRLFSEINHSVHNHGRQLSSLRYHLPNGKALGTLLRRAEIQHLKDVAKLINLFFYLALGALALWLAALFYFQQKRVPLPNLKQQSLSMLSLVGLSSLSILIIGPTKVFYAFHVLLFPAKNQWFFYYQESLMTILMKAPDLFGYIAILITLLSLPLFVGLNLLAHKVISNKG